MNDQFTPQARKLWERIPKNIREELLANVWCATCRNMTSITDYAGNVEKGDLILEGKCKQCCNDVARLIESE